MPRLTRKSRSGIFFLFLEKEKKNYRVLQQRVSQCTQKDSIGILRDYFSNSLFFQVADFKGLYSFINEEHFPSFFLIFILLEKEEQTKEFYFFYFHFCIHMVNMGNSIQSCFKRHEGYFSFLILFSLFLSFFFFYFSGPCIRIIETTKNKKHFFVPPFFKLVSYLCNK